MKTKIEKLLKENYKYLPQEQLDELTDKMCELLPKQFLKLSEIAVGSKFTFKGYEFIKLADEEETYSCYCIFNGSVFGSQFGETNDWAKSLIRRRLNKFKKDGFSEVLPNIHESDLVLVSLNYYTYKVPNGRTTDRITLPSWEEFIAYNFSPINKPAWLRSGSVSGANRAYGLDSSGGGYSNYCTYTLAVRPALHLKSDIDIEVEVEE